MTLSSDGFEQSCDLCAEIRLGGTALTGRPTGHDSTLAYSRLIRRTSVLDAFAGLGAIIPGYVLLMPRRHVRSMGELTVPELRHVFDTAWMMADRLRRVFNGSVVLVEHGSSGEDARPAGACIEHAHMHLFPLTSDVHLSRFKLPESARVHDISWLNSLARDQRSYYFSASSPSEQFLATEPSITSQHARRVWADILGRGEEWDWALFPHLPNARLTAARLRLDALPSEQARPDTGDLLAETLRAYDAAADWYAAQTSEFPVRSKLRAEMDCLAQNTEGTILDAGSGVGRDARYFAEMGRDVVALDASAPLLAHVPARKNIRTILGDVRDIQLPRDSMGAVWCSAVLLHLDSHDALRALREFRRVVKRNGLVHVSVKEGTGHTSSAIPGHPGLRRNFFFFEGEDLTKLARLAGLDVVKVWTEDEPDSTATVQSWVKALLRNPAA